MTVIPSSSPIVTRHAQRRQGHNSMKSNLFYELGTVYTMHNAQITD